MKWWCFMPLLCTLFRLNIDTDVTKAWVVHKWYIILIISSLLFWGSYRPSASPSYEASSHVKNYAYSGKLLLLSLKQIWWFNTACPLRHVTFSCRVNGFINSSFPSILKNIGNFLIIFLRARTTASPPPPPGFVCMQLQLEHYFTDHSPMTVSPWLGTLTGQDDWVQKHRNTIECPERVLS